MLTLRLGAACLVLAAASLSGCDSATRFDGTATTFRTEGTDDPNAAVALSGGQIVVGALVEGVIAPADGTIGYPAVIQFDEDGAEAAVYDNGDRSFFGVDGIAALGNGLAIAIGSQDGAEIYRTDRRGRSRERIARLDARFFPDDALRAIPGGLVVAAFPAEADSPHLYGLSTSGAEQWTYRLPEAQDVRSVSVRPDGDLVVAGAGRRGGEALVARLSPDGEERWRVELAATSPTAISSTDEATVVVAEEQPGGPPVLVRLGANGETLWTRSLADPTAADPEAAFGTRVLLLADGRSVVGVQTRNRDFESGNAARLVTVGADGQVAYSVGIGEPGDASTFVQGLVALPDGRLGVVLAVGPKPFGGFGGDDFDIEVVRLGVPG